MRRTFMTRTGRIALAGVLAAGAVALLWLACLAPSGRIGLAAVAGLFPVAAVLAADQKAGYLCWAASGLLGLILLPDKGLALLYLIFLGLYPVGKARIESMRRLPLEWVCKLVFFNAVFVFAWLTMRAVFLPSLPQWMETRGWIVCLLANVIFILYDIGLSRLIGFLMRRRAGNRF